MLKIPKIKILYVLYLLKRKPGILPVMEAKNVKPNSAMTWINCVCVHQIQFLMEIPISVCTIPVEQVKLSFIHFTLFKYNISIYTLLNKLMSLKNWKTKIKLAGAVF